jgi:DNA invertase Pin-like site-specific DNA recombinase
LANPSYRSNDVVFARLFLHPATMEKRIALYARVSTGEQTTENQLRELHQAAERHGWRVVGVYDDNGISGVVPGQDRPAMRRLLMAVGRREVDLVAAWSVDRLGRSLLDVLGFLGELQAKEIDLYLHQQGIDTSTPAGRALFSMLGVFSEFERAIIRERINAGLARARANGTRSGRPIGRPTVDHETAAHALALLAQGQSNRSAAKAAGLSEGTVRRLRSSG